MHSSTQNSVTASAQSHQFSLWQQPQPLQQANRHLNGAALVLADGRELPITDAMIERSLQQLLQR